LVEQHLQPKKGFKKTCLVVDKNPHLVSNITMKKREIIRSFTTRGVSNIVHMVSIWSGYAGGTLFGVVNGKGEALSVFSRNLSVATRLFEERIELVNPVLRDVGVTSKALRGW